MFLIEGDTTARAVKVGKGKEAFIFGDPKAIKEPSQRDLLRKGLPSLQYFRRS
jgi:hypothetical protein